MSRTSPSKRLRLYLIRHGEVEGAADGRVFGHTDVSLSVRGLEQSRQLADSLASRQLSAVYSSDLQRASLAAEMIAGRQGLKAQPASAWREIDMGEWEGRSVAGLHKEAAGQVAELFSNPSTFAFPGGESFSSFTARIQTALEHLQMVHSEGEIALVAHAGVCRAIIGRVLEIPMQNWLRLSQDYGCLNVIDWYGASPVVKSLNAECSV